LLPNPGDKIGGGLYGMNFIVGRITKALYVHIDSAMRDIEQSAF
jgi:hypothetical protein